MASWPTGSTSALPEGNNSWASMLTYTLPLRCSTFKPLPLNPSRASANLARSASAAFSRASSMASNSSTRLLLDASKADFSLRSFSKRFKASSRRCNSSRIAMTSSNSLRFSLAMSLSLPELWSVKASFKASRRPTSSFMRFTSRSNRLTSSCNVPFSVWALASFPSNSRLAMSESCLAKRNAAFSDSASSSWLWSDSYCWVVTQPVNVNEAPMRATMAQRETARAMPFKETRICIPRRSLENAPNFRGAYAPCSQGNVNRRRLRLS